MQSSFHEWAGDRKLKVLVFAVLLLAAVALAGYAYFSFKSAENLNYYGPASISVTGKGEVTVTPDIVRFSFGVSAQNKESASAQKSATEVSNKIVKYLKEQGIAEKDIKTSSYNLYPRYKKDAIIRSEISPSSPSGGYNGMEIMSPAPTADYLMPIPPPPYPSTEDVVGYTVEQTVQVKVRDQKKAGDLISGVGQNGATNISGLEFILGDDTAVKAEAQAKAVADAKEKARQLASALGVRLVRLSGFSDGENGYPYGGGCCGSSEAVTPSPEIPSGQNTVTSTVTLTYEVR